MDQSKISKLVKWIITRKNGNNLHTFYTEEVFSWLIDINDEWNKEFITRTQYDKFLELVGKVYSDKTKQDTKLITFKIYYKDFAGDKIVINNKSSFYCFMRNLTEVIKGPIDIIIERVDDGDVPEKKGVCQKNCTNKIELNNGDIQDARLKVKTGDSSTKEMEQNTQILDEKHLLTDVKPVGTEESETPEKDISESVEQKQQEHSGVEEIQQNQCDTANKPKSDVIAETVHVDSPLPVPVHEDSGDEISFLSDDPDEVPITTEDIENYESRKNDNTAKAIKMLHKVVNDFQPQEKDTSVTKSLMGVMNRRNDNRKRVPRPLRTN